MKIFFLSAALLATFNTALHFFAGGKAIARPLLDAVELPEAVKYVQYFCWHIATLALAFQATLFWLSTIRPGAESYAIVATALAASIGLLGITIPVFLKVSYRVVPQGWLFVPVAGLGTAGLVALS